ncbi:proline-rich transmembrane protein 1-like isoform X1 [Pomacea canaliculata]|uniref:proline-rich transmembrane protein 1-like isoform X1 n=1 Tax=Pomacea canaliculata TaxID=400727 RepID=UPI000D736E8F|nr:proline-rich transmembrane protein 1-like isoform X1 [Pomacea canaliculata]
MDPKQAGNQPEYPQQGYDGGYASLPGYVAQPGYAAQPGYTVQPQQGHSYNHSAVVVTQPVAAIPVVNSVTDNMGLAIFTTICCCWPIGLFAIMKASESRTALASGDFQRAQTLSQESRRLSLFSIAGGCVSIVIVIIAVVVSITNRSSDYYYSY